MKPFDALFHRLAAEPSRYWTAAWMAFGVAKILALVREIGSGRAWTRRVGHPAWLALAMLLSFIASRWPS